jgi:hypothetical protein
MRLNGNLLLFGLVVGLTAFALAKFSRDARASSNLVTLENSFARLSLDELGNVVSIFDKSSKAELCADKRPFAVLVKDGKSFPLSACSFSKTRNGGKLLFRFADANASVAIDVSVKQRYFVFKVAEVSGSNISEIVFAQIYVKQSKNVSHMVGMVGDEQFSFCMRALNLQTNVRVSGKPATLAAICYSNYGFKGAGVALVASPTNRVRDVLKEVVKNEGILHTPLGGPFALDAKENRLSYVFATVSEGNVDEWISLAKKSGLSIIHFIGWEKSYGHYEPRNDLFPNGLLGMKRVVEKIHAAGLKAGLHILTAFISPHDPYVTPIPDKRLAKRKTFTLAKPISEKDEVIFVNEKPEDMDVIWAYASRGNVLQIDDELVQYSGYSQEPPYRFFGCKRGAFGTKASAHEAGTKVHYLYSYYGAFYPDENSTLLDEIADRIANVVNECGFDMIYQDGAEATPGGWYGVAKMRAAIVKRLKRPVRVEASEWGYHSWTFHSCIGAWDHPCWGLKRFVDIHCSELETYRRIHLLPGQLGWWVILGPTPDYDAETPDEMEYLLCKALGYDAPISLQGVSVGGRPWNARQDEYLAMIGKYERLRLANYFSEAIKSELRKPGKEFRLVQAKDKTWQFLPTQYIKHKVTGLEDGSNKWVIDNQFEPQPLEVRIKALYAAMPYDSPDSIVIADFTRDGEFKVTGSAQGVKCGFTLTKEQVKVGNASGLFFAQNEGAQPKGSWARITKSFSPPIDLSKQGAIALWIYGDGKGEILNFQLRDLPQYYHGTYSDHYVDVNFVGWRYFELLLRERDAERYVDYAWPYAGVYQIFRTPLVKHAICELNIYLNNIPQGEEARCYISPIRAVPIAKVKLSNPSISVNGKRIVFPVTLESGQSIEFKPPSDCKVYDERGELIATLKPIGETPTITRGRNFVAFDCEPTKGFSARAEVTVVLTGKPLVDKKRQR